MAYNPNNPNGQATSANSAPAVLASDSAVKIDQTNAGVTNGVQITALSYPVSTGNNSVAQLEPGATFTGAIETVLSLQAAQVMVTCDTAYTVFIDQFIDLAGTKLIATYTFTRLAGVPTNENVTLPGNYMRIRVINNGAATTTTFRLDTTFGIMNTQPNTLSNLGNLRVVAQENGVPSVVNSTEVNLAANATFTGTAEDASEFSTVMVTIFSSHASAIDGLSVQFSSNGTNWDFSDVYTIPATTGKVFSFGVLAKFFRVVYTNGATLTTSLRLQSLFSRTTKKSSSQRPSDGRANDNDFEEVTSFLMGYNATTNAWSRLKQSDGALQTMQVSGRVLTGRYMYSSFRTLGTAATPQNIFTIENPAASGKKVAILRLTIQSDSTAALATVSPSIKTSRSTALPTGGTVGTATKFETAFVNAVAIIRNATASDGGAATAIAATAGPTAWGQLVDRQQTAAGFITHNDNSLLPQLIEGNPLVLLVGEALLIQGVIANAATTHFVVNIVWEEYT